MKNYSAKFGKEKQGSKEERVQWNMFKDKIVG